MRYGDFFWGGQGARQDPAHSAAMEEDTSKLTAREREVLMLLLQGKTNAEIADALWISLNTVKFHVKNIRRKLGAGHRLWAARAVAAE